MPRDLPALVAQLDLDEKATLLAGADLFSTAGLERHGIPAVRLTDGANGAAWSGARAPHRTARRP